MPYWKSMKIRDGEDWKLIQNKSNQSVRVFPWYFVQRWDDWAAKAIFAAGSLFSKAVSFHKSGHLSTRFLKDRRNQVEGHTVKVTRFHAKTIHTDQSSWERFWIMFRSFAWSMMSNGALQPHNPVFFITFVLILPRHVMSITHARPMGRNCPSKQPMFHVSLL